MLGVEQLRRLLEVDEDRELVLQDLGGVGDRVRGRHGAVGPDLEVQPVEVRLATDASRRHRVVHLRDRREDRVDRNRADRHLLGLVLLGGAVALAGADRDFHLDVGLAVRRHDPVVRIQHVDRRVFGREVAGRDHARAGLANAQRARPRGVHPEAHFLEVQDDVGDVLDDAGDRRELVQHAVDAQRRDRGALSDDSSTRRSALPSVTPKPRSSGSHQKRP